MVLIAPENATRHLQRPRSFPNAINRKTRKTLDVSQSALIALHQRLALSRIESNK